MKSIKKFIIAIVILEVANIIIGFSVIGKDVFLPYIGFNDLPLYYDMDSLYGVTKLKNTKQLINYPWSWGGIPIKTNALGFRDDEFKDNGVLVVGNSFVEGYGIKAEDRFSEILEKQLKTPFNNAGSAGVWTPIQSLVLLKDLLKNRHLNYKKAILILTPGDVSHIGERNPRNDPCRSFPYRKNDSIVFYHSPENNFNNELEMTDKIKRLFKSTFISKLYRTFKYYGASKVDRKVVTFKKENLQWFLEKIEDEHFDQLIDVVVINNLMRIDLMDINEFVEQEKYKGVKLHSVQFPNEQESYFSSNGHINEKGNKILAKLLKPIFTK